jgi:putative transposase
MTRPIRINVAGGWYHVTGRGTERRVIYEEEAEYAHFLDLLAEMRGQYRLRIHAYVLMPNHYHLLIETPEANLSSAMQWLNTSYGMLRNPGRIRTLNPG